MRCEGLSRNWRWVQRLVSRYDLPGKTSLGAVTDPYRSARGLVARSYLPEDPALPGAETRNAKRFARLTSYEIWRDFRADIAFATNGVVKRWVR